ncbi:hypothetical protein Hanom_Chr02g00128201 [Helianthus anomalus]
MNVDGDFGKKNIAARSLLSGNAGMGFCIGLLILRCFWWCFGAFSAILRKSLEGCYDNSRYILALVCFVEE